VYPKNSGAYEMTEAKKADRKDGCKKKKTGDERVV
jgi:hypothetical protein